MFRNKYKSCFICLPFSLVMFLVVSLYWTREKWKFWETRAYVEIKDHKYEQSIMVEEINQVISLMKGHHSDSETIIAKLYGLKRRISENTLVVSKAGPVETQCQSEDNHKKEVCDEHFLGPWHGSWHDEGWQIDMKNCTQDTKSVEMKDLITILIVFEETYFNEDVIQFGKRINEEINLSYKGVKVLIATNHQYKTFSSTFDIDNVHVIKFSISATKSDMWLSLVRMAKTPYVLVGRSLHTLYGKWINFERSIRILGNSLTGVVGGAIRNQTGHWKASSGCKQVTIQYFQMILRNGYAKSSCNCMECNILENDYPFVARTHQLKDVKMGLDTTLNSDLMFWAWFVKLSRQDQKIRLCPDVLYITYDSQTEVEKKDWQAFAQKFEILSINTYTPPSRIHTFSCDEIQMTCDPYKDTENHVLSPWCCNQAFTHMMTIFDRLSSELSFHYEIDSGTLLGAVKLNNFIPWDLDGDLFMSSHAIFEYFQGGQIGTKSLQKEGISVFERSDDCYSNKGAGYFKMGYRNFQIEVLGFGQRKNLTMDTMMSNLSATPTKIQIAQNLWVKAHLNPGRSVRGRYGKSILKHVQSWRSLPSGMDKNSFISYSEAGRGGWMECGRPGHHSCLISHPVDGNLDLIPEIYPGL